MRHVWIALSVFLPLALTGALDQTNAAQKADGQAPAQTPPPTAATVPPIDLTPVVVTGENEDQLQQTSPSVGARVYQLGPQTIEGQGRGANAGFDEILLHAPGVSRETSGQFHLRSEDYG